MTTRKYIPALSAFFVAAALLVSGCGSSSSSTDSKVGPNDVAVVAGHPISKKALLHWMYVDEKGQSSQQGAAEPVIVPSDPPNFNKCIAQVRADIPTLAKSSDKTIRADCKSLFTSLEGQVMQFLVSSYWYQGAAHKLGIHLTKSQLQQAIDAAKKQSGLKTDAQYQEFLKSSGYTDQDIAYRIRVSKLYNKLLARHSTTVSDAEIANYYKAHSSDYGSAEKLNLRMVLAKTQANAKAAQAALKSGQSWDTVAEKYSIDPTTKNNGGLLSGITANEEDSALSKAAFAASPNQLEGPVKGQFGYYVFEVLKKIPATQETLKQATPAIHKTLTTQKQSAAAKAVNTQASNDFKSQTVCVQKWAVAYCSNYVKPKTTSASASAGSGATATSGASGATQTAPTKSSQTKSGSHSKKSK